MTLITTVSDLDLVTKIVTPEYWVIKINQKIYFFENKNRNKFRYGNNFSKQPENYSI